MAKRAEEARKMGMSYGAYVAWLREKRMLEQKDEPAPIKRPEAPVPEGLKKVGVCCICGGDIIRKNNTGEPATCGPACREEANRRRARLRYQLSKIGKAPEAAKAKCPVCGKAFRKARRKKYCCHQCYLIANAKMNLEAYRKSRQVRQRAACPQCGKEFEQVNGRQIFCCKQCANKYSKLNGSYRRRMRNEMD